ncbi:unnamed protein product [Adineta ricciae]|uniref:EGF-like domain-containing protein n=1 Tax=Adineta ricciae TaxID=249248 RepID=A0A815VID4_ADIRI|nr:unnamed protein product [Adineta ricciae]CAF1530629.1 unnamed protein product [Adineta ricciae]
MELRCCFIDDMESIIAVDLTDFNLTQIPDLPYYSNLIPNMLDIRLNEEIVPQKDDFVGGTDIVTLFLPPHYACPGGDRWWNIINSTTDPPGNLCSGLKNPCLNNSQICPEPHSYCSPNGPNHTLCLCKGTYHGYKCLRSGQFPTAVFLGSACAVTVLTAALFYWTTRRHVGKHQD